MTDILYTLAPSHFCERARWALDRRGRGYVERRLALGPHLVQMRAKGLPSASLPVLQSGGTLTQGSDRILDLCEFPVTDPALEARFETVIGPLVRRFIYAGAFSSPNDGGITDLLLDGVGGAQRLAGLAAWRLVRGQIAKGFGATTEALPEIKEALEQELAWFEGLLLRTDAPLGANFGRSDITAASLLAPLVGPPEGAVKKKLTLEGAAQAALGMCKERPFASWVRTTYRRHRADVEPHVR